MRLGRPMEKKQMTRTITLFLGLAALALTALPADARDGCGEGWFFNGVACAPQEGIYQRGPYGPPLYAPERHYYGNYGEHRAYIEAQNNRPPVI